MSRRSYRTRRIALLALPLVTACAPGLQDGFSLFFFLDKKETIPYVGDKEKTMLSTALPGRKPAVFSGPRAPIATDSYQQCRSPVSIYQVIQQFPLCSYIARIIRTLHITGSVSLFFNYFSNIIKFFTIHLHNVHTFFKF